MTSHSTDIPQHLSLLLIVLSSEKIYLSEKFHL
jgi:hypothetical protein